MPQNQKQQQPNPFHPIFIPLGIPLRSLLYSPAQLPVSNPNPNPSPSCRYSYLHADNMKQQYMFITSANC